MQTMLMNDNRYIKLAMHAIGLDRKKPYTRHGKKFYKPYRNFFATHRECKDYEFWEEMKNAGYANSNATEKGEMFWLTRDGLDWLGEHIGVYIHDEEN